MAQTDGRSPVLTVAYGVKKDVLESYYITAKEDWMSFEVYEGKSNHVFTYTSAGDGKESFLQFM